MKSQSTAILLLADGTTYYGKAFGKKGTTTGEICFNTGMTGYQEVFTDPSYYGQIVIMNNVHVGNYGVKKSDVESDSIKIQGLIGRNLEELYSRKQAEGSLEGYLEQNGVVAIEDVDTRALVSHVRTAGAMNCIISSEVLDVEQLKALLDNVPGMDGLELASKVSTATPYEQGNANSSIRIAELIMGLSKTFLPA